MPEIKGGQTLAFNFVQEWAQHTEILLVDDRSINLPKASQCVWCPFLHKVIHNECESSSTFYLRRFKELDALFGPVLLKVNSGGFDGILVVAPLLSGLEPGTQASKWSMITDYCQAGAGGARVQCSFR